LYYWLHTRQTVHSSSTTARRTFFKVIGSWNSLPQHVIEAPSVNAFKNRLDRRWSDMSI